MSQFCGILFTACALLLAGTSGLFADNAEIRLFQRHYMERGNYKDVPLPGEDVGTVKLFAARGEYEPAQILIRSRAEARNVSVTLEGDFKGNQTSIPKDCLSIRLVADQKHWLDTRRFERMPYLLTPNRNFDLKPEQTERIWISIHVPKDAQPGSYSGNLKVTAGGGPVKTIPVELTVWPFELREIPPDEMAFFMYFGLDLPGWIKDKDYLRAVFNDMREHGMNSVTAYTASISAKDCVGLMKETGMLKKGGKFIWLGAAVVGEAELKNTTELVEKEGLEMLYYGVDEPSTEKKQELQRKMTKKLKQACPDKKIITALDGEKTIEAVGDCLDVWILEAIDLNERTRKLAEEKGRQMYSYECRLSPVDPLNSRHYWGLMAWRAGVRGASHWYYGGGAFGAFTDRFGTPIKEWTDFDPECQYKFDYVVCASGGILPSIGWDGGVREGVDDRRYISTLSQWIGVAKKAGRGGLAADGEKLLSEIKGKINPENYRKAFDRAFSKKEVGRGGEINTNFHRPPPEPGLKPADYDEIRRQIAGEIVKISSAIENKE